MYLALAYCAGPAALSGIAPSTVADAPVRLPPVAVWLALARRALGASSHEEALRCFENALKHEPTNPLAHLGRATCLCQLGRDDEAREATGTLLDVASGQEEVLYHLARSCAREGQVAIGVSLLTEAVRRMPALEEQAARDVLFADHPAYLMAIGRL